MLQRRLHPCQVEWRSYASCRGKDLSCGTTRSTGCTYKSSGMLPSGDLLLGANCPIGRNVSALQSSTDLRTWKITLWIIWSP